MCEQLEERRGYLYRLIRMLSFVLLLLALITSATSWASTRHTIPRAGVDDSSAARNVQAARTGPTRPSLRLSPVNLTTGLRVLPTYPIDCFMPSPYDLQIAIAADCEFVINEIILRLPNPMQEQSFGFDEFADIDLGLRENRHWHHGQCVVTLDSQDQTQEDYFRPLDVAVAVQRIVQRCIVGTKDALGGTVNIGSILKDFHLIVGGLKPLPPSHTSLAPPPGADPESVTLKNSEMGSLDRRSDDLFDLIYSSSVKLPIACVKPGMPAAAGTINIDDCAATAKTILSDPQVLTQRPFTTESTRGIHVPFVEHVGHCWFQVNTRAHYSSSDVFSLLKVVYFASEVMRTCQLGGVAKISGQSGFFVSVTGVDPGPRVDGLASLLNSTTFGLRLDSK